MSKMDVLLPAIRKACIHLADDMQVSKMARYDAYILSFRPKIRSHVTITGPLIAAAFPDELLKHILDFTKLVKDDIDLLLDSIDDGTVKIESDTIIEFSLGEQSP